MAELPNTGLQAPSTKLQAAPTFLPASGKRRLVLGTWSLELGTWSLSGVWFLVFGVFAVVFYPVTGFGSTSSALREYKGGQYPLALKEYQRLLERNNDDPRLHFNAGTAAYRNQQFDEAAKQFNAALNARDLKLQELAYYNRGNSQYWLGERNPDQKQKSESWEKAIHDYDLSLKLNPQDADARYNLEFVKKRLEELKQQQQQQQDQQKKTEPSEEAKRAKAAADEAVKRRDYPGALDIMQKQLDKDPTTAYYNDYIQRLKEVNGVQDSTNH